MSEPTSTLHPLKKTIICDDAIPYVEGRLEPLFNVRYMPGREIRHEDIGDAEALLVRTRTACNASLLKDTGVSLVATATIGTDHFNLPELDAMGIRACNAPGCNAPAVAQYVWSALLRLGFDPSRHTLGVVGKGHVGGIVTAWGQRLGCKVMVCDPPRAERGLTDEDYRPLQQLLQECDAVTLHTPLTRSGRHMTYHLLTAGHLHTMKPGAILVNAARGGVVEEKGLLEVIGSLGIRAVTDTWEGEPVISQELMMKSVYATPHIAGYSLQGKQRATRMVLQGLEEHFGCEIDKSGLEGPYVMPDDLTAENIMAGYDPADDTALLRSRPDDFENLRNHYNLRNEV